MCSESFGQKKTAFGHAESSHLASNSIAATKLSKLLLQTRHVYMIIMVWVYMHEKD